MFEFRFREGVKSVTQRQGGLVMNIRKVLLALIAFVVLAGTVMPANAETHPRHHHHHHHRHA
jgi:hypothetical protein